MTSNPSVLGTNRGHDQGVTTPPTNNGADGQERVSTGGGPPGARVRGQHGQEYMRQGSGVNENLYQLKRGYGLLPRSLQEPFHLQPRRGKDFVQQQRRSMQQGQRKKRWCRSS